MAAELRYMKSLCFGPPPGKVRRIAPRNVLASVPSFFLSSIPKSFPEQFSPNPVHFFGWGVDGFFVANESGDDPRSGVRHEDKGAWLRSCISRLKPKIAFNSHTRANHPVWGLGRRMFLDNPLNIKVQMLSYLPKCYIMDAVAMLLSSEHVRANKLYSAFVMTPTFQGYLYAYPAPAFCHCYYRSRIFAVPTLSFYEPQ
ncbi:unnamed protein product [Miscanthus lutarioriparius]|uniref:Uncharacterized protein n=1 Tax=Miscanthus lutarioriparius TaxID=422564 RepID=A0A811MNT8_9POAL|nr:unnamed protein product [Miscanthus lutarioriparius]